MGYTVTEKFDPDQRVYPEYKYKYQRNLKKWFNGLDDVAG